MSDPKPPITSKKPEKRKKEEERAKRLQENIARRSAQRKQILHEGESSTRGLRARPLPT